MTFQPKIVPLGDSAVLIQLGEKIDIIANQRIHALTALINVSRFEGVIETVPAYTTLLVHYDPLVLSFVQIENYLWEKMAQINDNEFRKRKRVEVPVSYGGEYGVDLESVAHHSQLRVEDVIRIHSQKIYTIFMMGFTPGFPYLGKLDDAIVASRLETPRPRVPAGTVAVAGSQTGIYSIDSPGGWQLIGWTSLQLFNPKSETPFLFSPGDEVKFIAEK